jgi:uncharacterized protein
MGQKWLSKKTLALKGENAIMPQSISDQQMAVYRATAQQQAQARQQALQLKHQRAWEIAQQAAHVLKQQYGVQKVAVFGSMVKGDRVHEHSDLDLAVWGLDPSVYYQAVSRLLDLDPTLSIDLVAVESAKPSIQAIIEWEGIVL